MASGNGVEIATAYVSLVISSADVAKQVSASLNGVQAQADQAGKGMGAKLASGVGATFKLAAAGIGLAAGAVLGTALSKGFSRMVAIDDAKGKLAGLGHQAEGIAVIMASANAAVTGTAFGMGEAATAAASAVAAGIKQGDDLTRYLTLIGDTATIAGTDLASMGSIFNKVQSTGKAYTDDLNMLADRGVPIFQWLQEEYGKSATELTKMVKDGKVDAETFRKVIQENIGGAAKESGKTLRGSWKNMQAALGRIGEAALNPFLPMMKSSLAGITAWADKVKPHVAKAAQYVATGLSEMGAAFQSHGKSIEGPASNWEKFGTRARQTVDGLKGVFSLLKSGEYLGKEMTFGFEEDSKVVDYILKFRDAIATLVNAVKNKDLDGIKDFFSSLRGSDLGGTYSDIEGIGATFSDTLNKLGDAAKTVGKSMVSVLGDAGVVGAAVFEHFARILDTVADNTWLITAGLLAYTGAMVAAKAVHVGFEALTAFRNLLSPATIAAQTMLARALTQHNIAIRAYLVSINQEIAATPGMIAGRLARARAHMQEAQSTSIAAQALNRWSTAAMTAAASANPLAAAFMRTGAAAATMGARVAGAATGLVTGVGKMAGSLFTMLGGPWAAAIGGAIAGYMVISGHQERGERLTAAYSAATVSAAKAQREFTTALAQTNGEMSRASSAAGAKFLAAQLTEITAKAKEGHSALESFLGSPTTVGRSDGFSTDLFGFRKSYDDTQRAIDQTKTLGEVLKAHRMDMEDLGDVVATGGPKYFELIKSLEATGDAGADVAETIKNARTELQGISDAARNTTPGLGSMTEAVKTLSSEAADADDRTSALKKALDSLAGKPVNLEDAMQSYNDQIRSVIKSTEKEWDAKSGIGIELFSADGKGINTVTDNGSKLRKVLLDLRDESAAVAAAGGDMGPVWQRNAEVLADLGRVVKLDAAQMETLAASVGLLPEQIELLVSMKGDGDATQKLTAMKLIMDRSREEGFNIDTRLVGGKELLDELQQAGALIEKVPGSETEYKVSAPNIDQVLAKIDELIRKKIPNKEFSIVGEYVPGRAQPGVTTPATQPGISVPGNATGGIAAGVISGAGGPTSDSVPALLSAGEHVWTAAEVAAAGGHGAMFSLRAQAKAGKLAFAEGGTPAMVSKAVSAARKVEGNIYDWGGTGPTRFDCSGFIGWLQTILMTGAESTRRLYTTHSLLGGNTAGLVEGPAPAGTWFTVGVSDDHMAGTLAGMPVESGGAHGTSGIGGNRAKTSDSQFPTKFYLPNELIKGYLAGQTGGKVSEWTDKDERDLERARLAVTQAEQKRQKVYEDPDSTAEEKRLAELDVDDARDTVSEKEDKKAKEGQLEDGERVAPQAPELTDQYDKAKADRIDAALAVEKANEDRNEIYDDPTSTDLEKQAADQALALARKEELESTGSESSSTATTVKDIFTNFASSAAGIMFDAAKDIFLPDAIADSHWWDVADEVVSVANSDQDDDGKTNADEILSNLPTFNASDILKQLGYNGAAPSWALNAKVFDDGGWLQPGEMGINLSSRPEPIFNSPDQLRQFAGSSLNGPSSGGGLSRDDVEAMFSARPNVTFQSDNINGAMRAYGFEQKKQTAKSRRR
ncbi:tape measure protein [Nocardia salmonicida]|uniref:tape measure protein n=1 Tax=Nocardia salmonicida TaxID=53431 RepID=UPI0033C64E1A